MSIPTFGDPTVTSSPNLRQASYAVIWDSEDRLLVVQGLRGFFLPGGGIEPGETAEGSLHREALEELGVDVEITDRLGCAIQHFDAEGTYWKMEARFLQAELLGEPRAENVRWLPAGDVATAMFHACHAWAALKAATR